MVVWSKDTPDPGPGPNSWFPTFSAAVNVIPEPFIETTGSTGKSKMFVDTFIIIIKDELNKYVKNANILFETNNFSIHTATFCCYRVVFKTFSCVILVYFIFKFI
jgi:hypothetical protein